jgi:hypothetical protein
MNRKQSKLAAIALLAIGWVLLPDFMTMGTTPGADILNFLMATMLAGALNITFLEALMLTFGIGFALIAAGLLVYPYNTKRLLVGRCRAVAAFCAGNPVLVVAGLVIFIVLAYWFSLYYDTVYRSTLGYAESFLQDMGAA